MSDWRSRAKRTEVKGDGTSGSWRDRAAPVIQPVEEPGILDDLANPRTKKGTLLQHFGQGASFGLTDELSGLAGAQDELSRRLWGMDSAVDKDVSMLSALLKRYRMERDSTRADLKKGSDTNPKTAIGAGVAGALMIPVPGPKKARTAAEIFSLARVGKYAKQGALVGAAYGAGSSDADLTKGEFDQFGKDVQGNALMGGAAGGVLGPVVEGAGAKFTNYLREGAADKAFRAMNGNAKIVNKARKMGFKTDEQMRALGRWALDRGLIPWSGDVSEIVARADELLDKVGPKIGDVSRRADAKGVLTGGHESGWFAPLDEGLEAAGGPFGNADYSRSQKVAKGAVEPMSNANMSGLAADDLANTGAADAFIERVADQGNLTPGSFEGMAKQKTAAQRGVFWGDKPTSAKEIHKDAVQRYTKDFEDQIGETLGDAAKTELQGLNSEYSNGVKVHEFATDASTRGQQGKYQNPIAKLLRTAGAGGAGAGVLLQDPMAMTAGAAAMGLAKVLENPAIMARTSDAAAKGLSASSAALASGGTKLSAAEAKAVLNFLRGKQAE